jgi:hypothetical protein
MKKNLNTIILILYNFLIPIIFSFTLLFYFKDNSIYLLFLAFLIGYVLIFFLTKSVYYIFSINKKSASINTIIISAICLFLMDISIFLDNDFNTQNIQQHIFHVVIWCSLLYHFVFKKSEK